jgi:hypothetical protein
MSGPRAEGQAQERGEQLTAVSDTLHHRQAVPDAWLSHCSDRMKRDVHTTAESQR